MKWRYGVVVVQLASLNESGVQKSCGKWAQFLYYVSDFFPGEA